uniref:NADH-ubiquinone oxidoreductase chain 2 n=1 Tax=Falcidens acutargatus TaxID=2079778 RepID=A0A343X871_9MOLL|nr:NADH dehydrogenase subunit 2 [Falcidens acutargatus]AWH02130.1 NADH dehydrogenase subunit 2 [Falcidens acutargatus]
MWPISLFFSFFMILGIFLMLSSLNWMSIWVGLELNLFGFLPLMLMPGVSSTAEASMKYFLVQAFGSGIFLSYSFFSYFFFSSFASLSYLFILVSLALKVGLSPFFSWFPHVMVNLSWSNCVILNTLQKIGPILLFSNFFSMNFLIMIMVASNAIFGATMGYLQSFIRSIMAYSSMVHLGWILSIGMISIYATLTYTLLYFILSSCIFIFAATISSDRWSIFTKMFILVCSLLSLGGLPPLTGFMMKMIGMVILLKSNLVILLSLMLLSSILSIIFYLNLLFFWSSSHKQTKLSVKMFEGIFLILTTFGLIAIA